VTRPRKTDRHLPACVYQKHGAYYYVKGGKWEPLGKSLAEALQAYAKRIETPKGGMASLIDRALAAHIKKNNLSKNTINQYTIAANKLKKYLVEFSPPQVKPKHVAAIKTKLAVTPNMCNRIISFLRIVFDYALEWQEVESNPCLGITRHTEQKRGRYLTDPEYAAIYANANTLLQLVMDLCYLTGQRVSDVLGIRLADLHKDGILFKPSKTLHSTQVSFYVDWTSDLAQVVCRAKALHWQSGKVRLLIPTLLFNRYRKKPNYASVHDLWARACKAAGVLDAHIHDLRAKALTDAERQGKDAQALGAHSTRAMTERYIKLRQTPIVAGPSFRHLLDEEKKG
jgi:integrase